MRIGHAVSLLGLDGRIAPNLSVGRFTSKREQFREWGGGLDFGLADDQQGLNFHYRITQRNRTRPALVTNLSDELGLNYTYAGGPHALTFRFGYNGSYLTERPPTYNVGVVYRLGFP